VELLLVLPVLFLVAVGIGQVSEVLLEKGRLERQTWTYAVSRAHRTGEAEAAALLEAGFERGRPAPAHPSERALCDPFWIGRIAAETGLPASYRIFVARECDRRADLKYLPPLFDLKAGARIPGGSLNGDEALKQSLWLEAMVKSGFGPIPLQLLGIADLAEAAAGVGVGLLGGIATELLAETAGRQASDFIQGELTNVISENLIGAGEHGVEETLENLVHESVGSIPERAGL
jgi:hypothetical protein